MEPGSGSRVFTKTKADFEELIKKSWMIKNWLI
jgi:hypothetical protein